MTNYRTSRRKFIKSIGLATAGIAASTSSWANIIVKSKKDKVRVALVGLGYYSTDILAPALQLTEACELKGIVTGSPEKIPIWQEKYGIPDQNVYNYENMHSVADNPDIDVIYIVLPPNMHSEYSIIAAEAGKHVWCEKPMAITEQECQAMIDAANKNKVQLTIGYRMHHEPNTQTIMKLASEKPYGLIKTVKAEAGYREGRTDHWKQKKEMGGGAMYDMGVYPLNAVRYTTGEEPMEVVEARHETTRPDIYTEVDETTYFTLRFPGGVIANCQTSFGKGMNELIADCEKGSYHLKPFSAYKGVKGAATDGRKFEKSIPNQQARQMDDDAMAILEDKSVIVPGEEGLKDIRIVQAIYKSAAEGKSILL